MLVLRKELKVGLGIGAAVLGVAVVYGAMSLLGSSGGANSRVERETVSAGDTLQIDADATGKSRPGLDNAVSGLPPKEPAPADMKPALTDPFAESARADGANDDKWSVAWSTGKVAADAKPALDTTRRPDGPLVTRTPVEATPIANANAASSGVATTGKYVIQPGDTYSSIAAKLYGSRSLYRDIEKANPTLNPTKLRPGMEINVPARDSIKSERGAIDVTPEITGAIDAAKQYRVQPGDTLHKISLKLYGKTNQWSAIYDLNKQAIGPDAGKLKVGTILTLPQSPSAQ